MNQVCSACGGLIGPQTMGAHPFLGGPRWCSCPTKPTPTDRLRAAAQAVVDRWDTPLWKDVPATAIYIEALRRELQK